MFRSRYWPGAPSPMPFSFAYDSNGVHFIAGGIGGYGTWNDLQSYLYSGGWTYSIPQFNYTMTSVPAGSSGFSCEYYGNYVFADNNGTRYSFDPAYFSIGGGSAKVCPTRSTSSGGSSGPYSFISAGGAEASVYDPDGTVYNFRYGCDSAGSTYTALPSSIEDRNGNVITISGPLSNCNGSFQVTDTLGRTALSSSGFGANGNTVTVAGLSSPYQLGWGTANFSFSVNAVPTVSESQTCGGVNAGSGTETVVTSLTLPNGQAYHFYYDSVYGLLNKVVYPNGGYVSYTWGLNSLAQNAQFPGTGSSSGNSCEYHMDSFAVQHRYVSYDGVHVALQQDFQYATNWISGSSFPSEWSTKTTTVTDRDLIAGTVNTTDYIYSPYAQNAGPQFLNPTNSSGISQIPVEQSIAYVAGLASTLQTVTKTWQDPYAMTSKTTTLP